MRGCLAPSKGISAPPLAAELIQCESARHAGVTACSAGLWAGAGLEDPPELVAWGATEGETCATLRILGLRDGVSSVPSQNLSVWLGREGAPQQSQDRPLT